MDLFLASATSAAVDAPCANDRGQGIVASNSRPMAPSSSGDQGFFESLVQSCGQENADPSKANPSAESLLPILGTGWSVAYPQEEAVSGDSQEPAVQGDSQEPAVQGDSQVLAVQGDSQELAVQAFSEEPGIEDDSQEPAVRGGCQEPAVRSNARARGPTHPESPATETRPGRPADGSVQVSNEPVPDSKGTFKLVGTWDQNVEPPFPRAGAGSSVSNPVAGEQHALASEAGLQSDQAQDETAERVSPSREEGGRAKGEALDAGPRTLLSRMEALKGTEEPGEQHLGDLKSAGRTGPGEADASWGGKEGASLKQEFQIDVPSRPAPSQAPSAHGVPFHQSQVASNGAFRLVPDGVHMRIHDEELGPMRWHIHMNDGRITAEAVVETTRVQELLQNHQDVLAAKLNALGVEVEDFEVFVDQGSQKFSPSSEQKGSGHTGPSTEDPIYDSSPDLSVSKVEGNQDQGLDLYA